DALVVGKDGLAVDRCHFPAAKHAERVRQRPAHSRGDLVGDTQRQRANVLMLDWECERPSLPKHYKLLACFLDAALSFDLLWRWHSRPRASKRGLHTTRATPLPTAAAVCTGVRPQWCGPRRGSPARNSRVLGSAPRQP